MHTKGGGIIMGPSPKIYTNLVNKKRCTKVFPFLRTLPPKNWQKYLDPPHRAFKLCVSMNWPKLIWKHKYSITQKSWITLSYQNNYQIEIELVGEMLLSFLLGPVGQVDILEQHAASGIPETDGMFGYSINVHLLFE